MTTKREIRKGWNFTETHRGHHEIFGLITRCDLTDYASYTALNGEVDLGAYVKNPIMTFEDVTDVRYLLVPTLAWNSRGYRVGRGGGFYDRLLSSRDFIPIFITLDAYHTDFEEDDHDVPAKIIVTESQVLCL